MSGRIVTADAMRAQRGTAAAIVAKGGDYALALKGNQGTLHEDVATYLDSPPASAELLSHQQVDKGHGRVEKRTATVCHDVDWLRERHDWPGLSAVGKVTAERRLASGAESVDTRYHILSAKLSAERFGRSAPTGRSRTACTGCWTCRWTRTGRATAKATAPPAWRSSGGSP